MHEYRIAGDDYRAEANDVAEFDILETAFSIEDLDDEYIEPNYCIASNTKAYDHGLLPHSRNRGERAIRICNICGCPCRPSEDGKLQNHKRLFND